MSLLVIAVLGMLAITGASQLSDRIGVASPLILLALGIAVGFLPFVPALETKPELVLEGVLPPLLYSTALVILASATAAATAGHVTVGDILGGFPSAVLVALAPGRAVGEVSLRLRSRRLDVLERRWVRSSSAAPPPPGVTRTPGRTCPGHTTLAGSPAVPSWAVPMGDAWSGPWPGPVPA